MGWLQVALSMFVLSLNCFSLPFGLQAPGAVLSLDLAFRCSYDFFSFSLLLGLQVVYCSLSFLFLRFSGSMSQLALQSLFFLVAI